MTVVLKWWRRLRPAAPLALLLLAPLPLGCGRGERVPAADGRWRVVATTGMVADAAVRVGGERARVEALMGPGVDPHLYKASAGDVSRLEQADLVLVSGLHLEARLGDVLQNVAGRVRAVAIAESIDPGDLLEAPGGGGQHDPHVWFDVALWSVAVGATGEAFAALDPERAAEYRARADAYRSELAELDGWIAREAAALPPERRVLVTAHDAFAYFGRRYGFEVRGLQGISTAAEAGTADVQALADEIAARRLPAIFVESSVPPRTIEAVQAAVRARGHEVRIGGSLYSDALGNPDGPAGTYPGMVRANVETIVSALRGN